MNTSPIGWPATNRPQAPMRTSREILSGQRAASSAAIQLGKFAGEQFGRLLAQPRRNLGGEQMHALADERVLHIAEVELNQEVADLGMGENVEDAPIDGLGTADDDRLRALKIIPIVR